MTPDVLAGRILIVDDDEKLFQMLEIALTRAGFTCTTASNAGLAADRLREQEFELVILDIDMPGKSGIEFLPEIKQYHPYTAVIMLTGNDDLTTAVGALQDGAYDYVTKPVRSMLELTQRIERALANRAQLLEIHRYQENLEKMVKDRTAELEQRMRELSGLNSILRTELNQNIGKEEDQSRLQESVGGYGSQLLKIAQQLSAIDSNPNEVMTDQIFRKAISDCGSQLGELANRMLETKSSTAGTNS